MDRLRCGTYFENYEKDMAIVQTRFRWACAIVSLIFLFSIPLFAQERILSVINDIAITLVAVQGLNILTGGCGQLSLGHASFMAVGAYTSGYLVGGMRITLWRWVRLCRIVRRSHRVNLRVFVFKG